MYVLTTMYVLTNGDGYVFHRDDGTHVLNKDELPQFFEEIREIAAEDCPVLIYHLVPAEEDFPATSL